MRFELVNSDKFRLFFDLSVFVSHQLLPGEPCDKSERNKSDAIEHRYRPDNRTVSHAVQKQEFCEFHLQNKAYLILIPIPKNVFNENYPLNPRYFGECLRKARMDAGLQIKELAAKLGVSEDTVINWEIRSRRPLTEIARKKIDDIMAIHS